MTSHITTEEIDALLASRLPRDTPFIIAHVRHSQLSVARHYGGARYNGWAYTYMPATDELIRDDVLKWVSRRRRMQKKAPCHDGSGLLEYR